MNTDQGRAEALLILDFDGTMTDAEAEAAPYREGYLEDLAVLADRPLDEVRALAERFEQVVAADRISYGWTWEGRVVAPAAVDPYLRLIPVARMILDDSGAFRDEGERARLLDGILYKYNYRKTRTAFRPGAAALLRALGSRPGLEVCIVTNSHTDPVQAKIRLLGEETEGGLDWLLPRVHGRARKYLVDDHFDAVPVALHLPGLPRPVLLRRRAYYEALDGLRRRHRLGWDRVWVVGDIFELDLALPLALGARVALAANEHTPPHELAFLADHPRARVIGGLDEVMPWLEAGLNPPRTG